MATTLGPIFPFRDPIAEVKTGLVTPHWRTWLRQLRETVDLAPVVRSVPPVQGASASQPVTSMDGGTLTTGLYAVSWYLAVLTAAGVSSSAQVTIGWVDQGVSKTYTAPAVTGNTTTTVQADVQLLIYVDGGSPLTYAITYASNPAGAMIYDFRPVVQGVVNS